MNIKHVKDQQQAQAYGVHVHVWCSCFFGHIRI